MTQIHRITRVEDAALGPTLPGVPRQTPDEPTISLAALRQLLEDAHGAPLGARLALRPGPPFSLGATAAVLTWEGPDPMTDPKAPATP